MSDIHKDMYIIFNIHTFNSITHNFNELYFELE